MKRRLGRRYRSRLPRRVIEKRYGSREMVVERAQGPNRALAGFWKLLKRAVRIALAVASTFALALVGWNWAYTTSLVYVGVTQPVAGQAFAETLRVSVSQFHEVAQCRVELRKPDDSVVVEATGLSVEWPVQEIPDGDYILVVRPLVRWPPLLFCLTVSPQVVAVPISVSKSEPTIELYGIAEGEYLMGSREVTLEVSGGALEAVSVGGIPKAIPRGAEEAAIPLDASTWQDGEYAIAAIARSRSGLTAEKSVRFRVDHTPPRIEAIGLQQVYLRGEVTVTAALEKDEEVEVLWLLNERAIGSGMTLTWDTRTATDGQYMLNLHVTDAAGHSDMRKTDVFILNEPPKVEIAPEVTLHQYFRFSAVPLRVKAEGARIISVEAEGVSAIPGSEEGLYWLVLRHFQHGETVKVVATAVNEAGTSGTGDCKLGISSHALLSSFTYNPHKLAGLLYAALLIWFFI